MRVTKIDIDNYKWDKSKTDFVPGNSRFKDRTGQRHGKLVYLYPIRKSGNNYWVAQCDCGNITHTNMSNIRIVKSCICGVSRNKSDNPAWKGYEEIPGNYLYNIKNGALKRNIDFDENITLQVLWDIFILQERKCALSGMDINFSSKNQKITASLDRIDSNKDYIIDNIQWVHKDVNLMKNHFDEDYFRNVCSCVVNLTKEKNE